MVEETRPKFDVDAIRRMREQISPQDAENRLKYRYSEQTDDQYVERTQAAVNQNLIDNDLEKLSESKK